MKRTDFMTFLHISSNSAQANRHKLLSLCSYVYNNKQAGLMSLCSFVYNNKQAGLMSLCSFVLIFCSFCLTGCGDGSCYDNGSAVPMARFYQSGTTTQVSPNGMTVSAIGAPGDTILIDNATVSDLHLPLRAATTSTRWRMTFAASDGTTETDTVTIDYRPIEYFANVECGAMYYFEITGVSHTGHAIDSVTVAQARVTHVDQVNLRIYLPTN